MAYKLSYAERKAQGICVGCNKANSNGKAYCPDCLEKRQKNRKENEIYLFRIGICTRCHSRKTDGLKKMCEYCLEKDSERYYEQGRKTKETDSERYQRLKAEGICTGCKHKKAVKGILCTECYAKQKKYKNRYKEGTIARCERTLYGLCYYCGNPLDLENHPQRKICNSCYEQRSKNISKFNESRNTDFWRQSNTIFFQKKHILNN